MILLVTRKDIEQNPSDAFSVVRHLDTPGFSACSGPHVRFSKLRVPAQNLLAPPGTRKAVELINEAFTGSAAMVGAMSVGIMRAAFESALAFAKTHNAGGNVKLLERQSVADLLIDIKMRIESSRYLTWKAAHAVQHTKGGAELAYEAKIMCSEAAITSVADAMKIVGV